MKILCLFFHFLCITSSCHQKNFFFRMQSSTQTSTSSSSNDLPLREIIANLRMKNDLLSKSCKLVLEAILAEMYDHYHKVHQSAATLTNEYFAVDKKGHWHMLQEDCTQKIEDLWSGRRLFFQTMFNGILCDAKLHDNMLHNGLPLVLLKFNEDYFALKRREKHLSHMTLFKFQPHVYGMKCDSNVASQWIRKVYANEVELYLNNNVLEKLSALWLGRTPRNPPQCVMFVDGTGMIEFLELIRRFPTYACFLLLSGQDPIFAYLQVNDDKQNIALILPVGTVVR